MDKESRQWINPTDLMTRDLPLSDTMVVYELVAHWDPLRVSAVGCYPGTHGAVPGSTPELAAQGYG